MRDRARVRVRIKVRIGVRGSVRVIYTHQGVRHFLQAGVRVGDTIVGLGGRGVRTSKELIDGLTEKVGQQVQLPL